MYNFFFTSFGKAYIAHFDKQEMNSHVDILCVNSSSRFILMEWDTMTYFSTVDSISKDVKKVTLGKVSETDNDNKIILSFLESKNAINPQCTNESINVEVNNGKNGKTSISYKAKDSSVVSTLDFELRFKEEYVTTITFHCVPLDDLYNVVLDFGSEASQMLICKNNPDSAVVPEKVFANTLLHFYDVQKVKGKRVFD